MAQVDWPQHLEKLTAFWCRALLGLPEYGGNPFQAHATVHDQRPLTTAHFGRWQHLDHTLSEAVNHLKGDFAAGVADYDRIHVQILEMSDMLTEGIVDQHPEQFS